MQQGASSPKHRLHRRSDFEKLRIQSSLFRGRGLLVYFRQNHLPQGRMAVSIRRTLAVAAKRNRVRRVLREFFRSRQDLFAGLDVLFVVKPLAPLKKIELPAYERNLGSQKKNMISFFSSVQKRLEKK